VSKTPSTPPPTALVVGASSGMGAELVRKLADRGYRVAALARRQAALDEVAAGRENVLTWTHDVTDSGSVPEQFEACTAALGGCDLFIYAAGVMHTIGPDEYDTQKDFDQLAVNLAGCVAWGNAVAPYMQSKRSGVLVGISSIAGDRGRKPFPAYHAAKAAVSTYLESLRNRLAGHGVHVCTIKPGTVHTPMTAGMDDLKWPITAEAAADGILEAIDKRKNTAYVPLRWRFVSLVIQAIPSFVFRRLNF